MGALTPQFVIDLETRMQILTENDYARMTANLWWQTVAKTRTSTGKKDILTWLLSTAQIRDRGNGGNIAFDDLVAHYTEIENRNAGSALKLTKQQLTDTLNGIQGGEGLDLAGQWSRDIGAYMAYWPQKQVAYLMKNGHTSSIVTAYDGKALFATDHPVNPGSPGAVTFSNLLTGSSYAIDESVTPDVALANLGKVFSAITSVKMPNGEDPRFLRPRGIFTAPKLFPRAVQLTSAKFLAMAASSGGGGADVEGLIKALGFATPTMMDEMVGYESDTTYFVVCEQASSSEMGPVVYVEREPFKINYYGEQTESYLSRTDEFEWHCKGRNVVAPGHPFLIFKVSPSS